jgi:hypothetical protein
VIDPNVLKWMNGDEVDAFVETLEQMFEADFEMDIFECGPLLGYLVGHLARYLERYPEHLHIIAFVERLIEVAKNVYKSASKSV